MDRPPVSTVDFQARLQWLFPGQPKHAWYLLCDRETVSLPEYIKGKALGLMLDKTGRGIWRKVEPFYINGEEVWTFVDQPTAPIQPITAKDYLAG